MIKTILHLFKIHRKMILGNPSVVVQNMLRKTPKSFYAVDMVPATVGKGFAVVQAMMLAQPFQGIVAPKRVSVVDRTFSGFFPNDRHELLFRYMLHNPRIYLAIALQKAKNNVFTLCTPSTLALASAAKVAFIHLYLAVQFTALKLCHMVDCFSEFLIDARDGLVVEAKVMRESVCRLLLVEALDNGDLRPHPLQGLLSSTGLVATPRVPPRRLRDLERTAENALFTPQKVGRAPENVLFCCNHKDILAPRGYETH